MYHFIMIIHVAACVLLIISVLLQSGKGAGIGILGSGGGGDALFAANTGSNFMKKFTTSLAITFAATSLLLTIFSARMGVQSVTMQYPMNRQQQTPQQPAATAADAATAQPAGSQPAAVPAAP